MFPTFVFHSTIPIQQSDCHFYFHIISFVLFPPRILTVNISPRPNTGIQLSLTLRTGFGFCPIISEKFANAYHPKGKFFSLRLFSISSPLPHITAISFHQYILCTYREILSLDPLYSPTIVSFFLSLEAFLT